MTFAPGIAHPCARGLDRSDCRMIFCFRRGTDRRQLWDSDHITTPRKLAGQMEPLAVMRRVRQRSHMAVSMRENKERISAAPMQNGRGKYRSVQAREKDP